MAERRFLTGFSGRPADTPGLVMDGDDVVVVKQDGTAFTVGDVASIPPSGPIVLSTQFPDLDGATDKRILAMVAPYDGSFTDVAYIPSEDIEFTGSDERTWTVENAAGDVFYTATVDEAFGPVAAGTQILLGLTDEEVHNVDVTAQDPLYFRSARAGSAVDPGGLIVFAFVDPPPLDLGTLELNADTGAYSDTAVRRLPGMLVPDSLPPPGGNANTFAPAISSVDPTHALAGTQVRIKGQYFATNGKDAVRIVSVTWAGIEASTASVLSDGEISAVFVNNGGPLPRGGNVEVTSKDPAGVLLVGVWRTWTMDAPGGGGGGGGGTGSTIASIAISAGKFEPHIGDALALGAVVVVATAVLANGSVKYPDSIEMVDVGTQVDKGAHAISRKEKASSPSQGKATFASYTVGTSGQVVDLPHGADGGRWVQVTAKWGALGLIAVKLVKIAASIKAIRAKRSDPQPGNLGFAISFPRVPIFVVPRVSTTAILFISGKAVVKSATMQMTLFDGEGKSVGGASSHSWSGKFTGKNLFWVKTNGGAFGPINMSAPYKPWKTEALCAGEYWPDGDTKKPAVPFRFPASGFDVAFEETGEYSNAAPPVKANPLHTEDDFAGGGGWVDWSK